MSVNPTLKPKDRNIINKICFYDESGVRDKVIVKNILNKLKEGCDVFVLYGQTHVAVLEPVLRSFFK